MITYPGCLYGPNGGHVHCRLPTSHRFPNYTTFCQGEIGILDRKNMAHFATIFLAYQTLEKSTDALG